MASQGTWLLFLACAFAAEVIGTMAGFGAATILTPIAALFMDIKAWVGRRLVSRISAAAFRRFVLVMLLLMGLKLVVDGWHGLA